jgi:hypothetical protein
LSLTDWIALGSLLAAVVAAIFAIRVDVFGRKSRAKDVRPQPRVRWVGPGYIRLGFFNVGGPAVHALWVGTATPKLPGKPSLFAAYATFDGHTNEYVEFVETNVGPLPEGSAAAKAAAAETLILVAQDVDGRWWDCLKDRAISTSVKQFVASQLASRHLDAFAESVYKEGRLG